MFYVTSKSYSLLNSCRCCNVLQVSCTVFAVRAMARNPELSIVPVKGATEGDREEDEDEIKEDEENGDIEEEEEEEQEINSDDDDSDDDDLGIEMNSKMKNIPSTPASKKNVHPQSTQKTLGQLEAESEAQMEGRAVDRDAMGDVMDGSHWVMQRLRGLGSDPRGRRRLHVIRVSE